MGRGGLEAVVRPQRPGKDEVGAALGLQGPGNAGLISLGGAPSLLSSSEGLTPSSGTPDGRQARREGRANNEYPEKGLWEPWCLVPASLGLCLPPFLGTPLGSDPW